MISLHVSEIQEFLSALESYENQAGLFKGKEGGEMKEALYSEA